MYGGSPAHPSRNAAAASIACRITQSPSGTISPLSSAISMNSSGGTIPRTGCCQRTSASSPRVRPVARSTMGW